MQLIADSGSTKTSWRLVENPDNVMSASTIGYNPHYFSTENMVSSLRELLLPQLSVGTKDVSEIHFYGAGCSTPNSISVITNAFTSLFEKAAVNVDHDLLGAARALCGKDAGIACILGTGSNSCAFDGENITDNVPSLGFMLGDEGSGASLGRRLVRSYFYREMPKHLTEALYDTYKIDKEAIFSNVYKADLPSRYMAQFTKFMSAHIEESYIRDLVKKEFEGFFDSQVMKYENVQSYPIHFLGSIAFYFKDILEEILAERGLQLGRIIREPIETLVDYHLS